MKTWLNFFGCSIGGFLIALSISAFAQQPAPPALSAIDQRFYTTLVRAAASTDFEKTKKSGGGGGGAFAEVRPEGASLVGLDVWEGDWNGHRIIRGLRPIFQTAQVRIRGAGHGNTPGNPGKTIEAEEGYAVAAMEIRGGDRLDGFQILFWKVRTSLGRLDAEGSYKSDWVGGAGVAKARNALSSEGRVVMGIYGASGADMDRLGLIYVPR